MTTPTNHFNRPFIKRIAGDLTTYNIKCDYNIKNDIDYFGISIETTPKHLVEWLADLFEVTKGR